MAYCDFSSFTLMYVMFLIIFEPRNSLFFKQDFNSALRLSVAAASIPLHVLDFRAPEPMDSVAQGIRRNCPIDYACITDVVKSSEATSGNIAFIVELLRNISTDLSDNVTREKMKVSFVHFIENTDRLLFFLNQLLHFNSSKCTFQGMKYDNHGNHNN